MNAVTRLGHFIWRMIRLNIASFDPLRRRRVRVAAKRLIPAKAWATENATADEIARVALLRVMFLQRETRRAARHAEGEAAAMLARASMEAAISGLFCINVPGAEKLFEGELARRAKKLLGGLVEGTDMAGMFDQAFAQIGAGKLPTVTGMVDQIKANGGSAGIDSLHANFYDQVSTLYVHGGPLGLIRHVHPKTEATLDRPYSAWSMRSAVHTSDAMVGLLAGTIAGEDHPDVALFREYEAAHFQVTWMPLAFIARGLMATRIDRRYVPGIIRLVRRLSVKAKKGEPFTEADVEEIIVKLNLVTGLKPDDPTYAPLADAFRAKLLEPRPNDAASPSAPPS
jgi:hypothetical protein